METGYLGPLFDIHNPIILNLSSSISEYLTSTSNALIELFDVQLVSDVRTVSIDIRLGNSFGSIVIAFTGNPADGDVVNIGTESYTFKDSITSTNDVLIGSSKDASLHNLYCAINYLDADKNLHQANSANTLVNAIKTGDSTLTIVAKESSVVNDYGNGILVGATSSGIMLNGSYNATSVTTGGSLADNIINNAWSSIGTYIVDWNELHNVSERARIIIPNITFSPIGVNYEFRLRFFGSNGSGALAEYTYGETPQYYQLLLSHTFYGTYNHLNSDGLEDFMFTFPTELRDYAAVNNLKCINAENPEGGDLTTPTKIPSHGVARLVWDDMSRYAYDLIMWPIASPSEPYETQESISVQQLSNISEYIIFMYIPNDNQTTNFDPTYNFPSNDDSTKGTWINILRTKETFCQIPLPQNKIVSFWVGFGTPETFNTTTLPVVQNVYSFDAENSFETDPNPR